jgi:hypothetical protein
MTVGLADLVELHCSPEMISSGIAFTCRAHLWMFVTQSKPSISRLRNLCSQSIASLGIRRWLTSKNVPHNLQAYAPLTNPHLNQIAIGGRPAHAITLLISNRDLVRKYRKNPHTLPQMRIPNAKLLPTWPYLSPGDLLLFSVLITNVCHSNVDSARRMKNHEEVSAVAISPRRIWRQQRRWQSLGQLTLFNPGIEPVQLEINGLAAGRSLVVERVTIPAEQSAKISTVLHNLLYLRTEKIPSTILRVESLARRVNWRITPGSWSNLWFYEPKLHLVGWLTSSDLDQVFNTSSHFPVGRKLSRVASFGSHMSIHDLRPVGELLQRIRHM